MLKQTFIGIFILGLQILPATAQTRFEVRHDHDPWGRCRGELTVSPEGIEFVSRKKAHSRSWTWTEIQSFDRLSDTRFAVLTWEDERRFLGLDRYFHFTVLDDQRFGAELLKMVRDHATGTVTDRIPATVREVEYRVPVKHLHTLGGCEGVLSFGPESVVFESDQAGHSRSWNRVAELESIWSLNRYQLEIHVFEENRRSFAKTRAFRFQLKAPLDRVYYERLRKEIRVEW